MWFRGRGILVVAGCISLFGCSDSTLPTAMPEVARKSGSSTGWIWGTSVNAYFYESQARGVAKGCMAGNTATINLKLTLTQPNGVQRETVAGGSEQLVIPFGACGEVRTHLAMIGTCGHLADATATYSADVQVEAGGTYVFSKLSNTKSDSEAQSACPTRTETSGGSDGGGYTSGGTVCHYRITYDLATGEIYSKDLLYCEPFLRDAVGSQPVSPDSASDPTT